MTFWSEANHERRMARWRKENERRVARVPLFAELRRVALASCLPFDGQDGICPRCGTAVVYPRRRWCSDECPRDYWRNHRFQTARAFVLQTYAVFRTDGDHRWPEGVVCVRCDAICARRDGDIQVNHIQPALGNHGAESCLHHFENLEPLCRECHRLETNRQRKAALALGVAA